MDDITEQGTIITDPVLIGVTLEKAKIGHSLLTVNLPDSEDEYLSVILDINDDDGQLYIDELKPASGNLALKKTKQLNAHAKLQGVSISFQSRLIRLIKKGSLTSLCIRFPNKILYHERRSSHRVPVAIGLDIYADIYDNGNPPLKMRVVDISAEGIGLAAKHSDFKQLINSNNEIRCSILFPDEEDAWNVRIEPCSGERPLSDRVIQVGAYFKELTTKQKDILNKQLRLFDRENIQRDNRLL